MVFANQWVWVPLLINGYCCLVVVAAGAPYPDLVSFCCEVFLFSPGIFLPHSLHCVIVVNAPAVLLFFLVLLLAFSGRNILRVLLSGNHSSHVILVSLCITSPVIERVFSFQEVQCFCVIDPFYLDPLGFADLCLLFSVLPEIFENSWID